MDEESAGDAVVASEVVIPDQICETAPVDEIFESKCETQEAELRQDAQDEEAIGSTQLETTSFDVRILIYSMDAGRLIGRGGEKIRSFAEKYGLTMTIPMSSSTIRVVIIYGKKSSVLNLLKELIPTVRRAPFDTFADKEFHLNVALPEPYAPIIIGTGGSRISAIRKDAGCSIKIFDENLPYSGERLLIIAGPLDSIIQAMSSVMDYMENNRVNRKVYHFEPSQVPFEHLLNVYKNAPPGGRRVQQARPLLPPFEATFPFFAHGEEMREVSFDALMSYPVGFPQTEDTQIKTIQVSIPSRSAGSIIGHNGTKIREIRTKTGCRIDIGSSLSGCTFRIITLTGTDREIGQAEFMMQKCVREDDRDKRKKRDKVRK